MVDLKSGRPLYNLIQYIQARMFRHWKKTSGLPHNIKWRTLVALWKARELKPQVNLLEKWGTGPKMFMIETEEAAARDDEMT